MDDVSGNIDPGQFGTEHMLFFMDDILLKLLESRETGTAVIASMVEDPHQLEQKSYLHSPLLGHSSQSTDHV